MINALTARMETFLQNEKRGTLSRGAPLQFKWQYRSIDDGINRAAVDTGATLGALFGDGVEFSGLYNCAQRASIDTGTTSDAVFVNFQSHVILLKKASRIRFP